MLWVLCEIAIAACDLAEVIGSAIALNLLFGIPLLWGVCITALDVLLILLLQNKGFRYLEALVIALIAHRSASASPSSCFMAQPGHRRRCCAGFVPTTEIVTNPAMLYIAIGILGATVMPHNLYLHSSIVQTRKVLPDDAAQARGDPLRHARLDGRAALRVLHQRGDPDPRGGHLPPDRPPGGGRDRDAYKLLTPLLGTTVASTLFALALLASGQNSTLTGTLAGQIVMEGFLNIRLRPWLRRLITRLIAIVPAVIVTAMYGEHGTGALLILSQVILSLQLSFAVFPLVYVHQPARGRWASSSTRPSLAAPAWAVAVVIMGLNAWLLVGTFREWFA